MTRVTGFIVSFVIFVGPVPARSAGGKRDQNSIFCKDRFAGVQPPATTHSNTAESPDEDIRSVVRKYGNPPAVYSMGGPYGAAPEDIPLFRGVAGPDHDLESVLRFMGGDRRFEPMSPTFKKAFEKAIANESFESAYQSARSEALRETAVRISTEGLKQFALYVTGGSSTGIAPLNKEGPILKFTNYLNYALKYAASSFSRNLYNGRRVCPVVFDATGNGGMVLGYSEIPLPASYREYDFLSNVSIRHIRGIYIGLMQIGSDTVWDMPWIKMTPTARRSDGSFQSVSVDFVSVEERNPMDIYARTNVWPDYELTNLQFRKHAGDFNLNGSIQLSPELNESERNSLKSFIETFKKVHAPN